MPTSDLSSFPLAIVIPLYVAILLLIVILIFLFRISGKISQIFSISSKSSRSSGSTLPPSSNATEEPEAHDEFIATPGTPYAEFLNEDPQRQLLSKKEQFKAFRKWRAEKGLNWSSKD